MHYNMFNNIKKRCKSLIVFKINEIFIIKSNFQLSELIKFGKLLNFNFNYD